MSSSYLPRARNNNNSSILALIIAGSRAGWFSETDTRKLADDPEALALDRRLAFFPLFAGQSRSHESAPATGSAPTTPVGTPPARRQQSQQQQQVGVACVLSSSAGAGVRASLPPWREHDRRRAAARSSWLHGADVARP